MLEPALRHARARTANGSGCRLTRSLCHNLLATSLALRLYIRTCCSVRAAGPRTDNMAPARPRNVVVNHVLVMAIIGGVRGQTSGAIDVLVNAVSALPSKGKSALPSKGKSALPSKGKKESPSDHLTLSPSRARCVLAHACHESLSGAESSPAACAFGRFASLSDRVPRDEAVQFGQHSGVRARS